MLLLHVFYHPCEFFQCEPCTSLGKGKSLKISPFLFQCVKFRHHQRLLIKRWDNYSNTPLILFSQPKHMDFSKFCRQMRERGNKSVLIIAVMWNRIRIGTDLPCGRPPGSGSAWRMRIQIQEVINRRKCAKIVP